MAEIKREYVVPLRRKTRTAPKWRRSKKAVSVLKEFIRKHMKTEDVVICSELNEKIWGNGIRNPPGKVSVIALKKDFGGKEKVLVNLLEAGVDNQAKLYEQVAPAAAANAPATEEKKEEVQEAEVKEVKEESPKKEEKKEAPKKKEEVKNE